ncbi:peptidase family M28 [Drepanopeziza brunnea f. sp. 'multigermtubi' MB_m1]|uniref:Peptide hydrolase n=1 Tax=Marssonina brunnea f. sp. multigermtubi (strain MB_m1) TaxID=1072389 RepID=K1WDE0_MARBU|nr:peptidase family M28 [Drepanopeziza brunnea f. sp. 'multigermtubi' MB_m1]EKD15430.1 peptidase family M28 [Drepanopeziza brunnea f. sp. 'multigermtubi' MB_m1]
MFLSSILAVLITSLSVVAALPPTDARVPNDGNLRLIKTSEADPGTWITEDMKIRNYVAKNIKFIDITDIKNETTLRRLSTEPSEGLFRAQAVTYPALSHMTEANALIAKLSNTGPKSWLTTLTNFFNRYYRSTYGTQAGTWLLTQVRSLASTNAAITVTTFTHSFAQPSIIVTVPGTSTNLIIIGAHYDSVGSTTAGRAPGADDNGSGVVVLMEALRVIAASGFKPKNTIEFHFYGGEEGGLLGSQAIFSSYASAGKTVLGFVCQDMAGYSPSGRVSVYSDYSDASLVAYVRRIVTQYTGLASTTDTCGYGCSDHASGYSNGFPSSYVCDEAMDTGSPYIHSASDTYATIMWDAILRHSKFTVGYLIEASYI